MKKLLLSLIVVCFSLSHLNAQDDMLVKGDKVVNLGIGFSSYWYGSTVIPPVSGSFEMGIVDGLIQGKGSVGVGGYLGYSSYKWLGYKSRNITIGARGAFHYPLVENLDTYAGVILGYNIYSDNDPYDTYNYGNFVSGEFIGARYYFSDSFAAMAEVGFGIFNLNLGVALKF
jgi:hypothetical protein